MRANVCSSRRAAQVSEVVDALASAGVPEGTPEQQLKVQETQLENVEATMAKAESVGVSVSALVPGREALKRLRVQVGR